MAEAILFNLASKVVEKIGSLALREVGLAWGLEDELKTLEARVSMIKAVLVDADQKQQQQQQGNNNLVISLWLERLEAAFYEADNVLDEFHYEALRRKVQLMRIMNHRSIGIQKLVRIFYSCSHTLDFRFKFKMSRRIEKIRKKLDMIVDDRTKFHPIVTKDQKQTGTDHKAASTSLSSNANESEFVGRDNDRARLLQLIMSPSVDHKNISVIPIVGIGGVGKTTLVKLLFNHETVVRHFDLRIWVTVAQDLNVKRVMQKIIQRITDSNSPCTGLNSSKIKKLIKEKLHGKNCLLVLDDGKHDGIAKLSEIAKEIVKKCHGCPLAPKTLGNNLFMETDESKWLDLKEKELWELAQKKHDILGVLRSSYNSLPTDLKRCFIYCSIFPKSYEIEIDKLIQLWRAQGIIKLCGLNRELEDTCIYGKEGVTKSLFELENLRTILFPFQGVGAGDNQGFVNRCISKFKYLHVLDFSNSCLKVLPDSIGNLKHLRFLDLSCENLRSLPEEMQLLTALTTVTFAACPNLISLPNNMKKPANLRNLEISKCANLNLEKEPRSLKSQMFNGKSADECVQITKRTAKREVTGFQCTINRGMACI
ncbi:unnamed protein product [Camellia sinensis]